MKQSLRRALAYVVSRLPIGVLTDREFFDIYEKRGVHITPAHFYQPIPDTRLITDRDFETQSDMIGIDMRLDAQKQILLSDAFATHLGEYHEVLSRYAHDREIPITFDGLDGAMLYHFVRESRPKRLIEVGSGFSTVLSAEAISYNSKAGSPGVIEAIEPCPRDYLTSGRLKNVTLRMAKVQDVPFDVFSTLEEGDIFFIDSSHVVAFRSDVVYEVNEILSRLKPGVLVHFHDIMLPYEYCKEWVKDRKIFWTEQYIVQAFLQNNSCFEVVWGAGMARAFLADTVQRLFPDFNPALQQAGSLWLRRVC